MDAPITDEELLELARGMAYDTATLLGDYARRLNPQSARHLRNVVHVLTECATDLPHYAKATPDTSARREQASEASKAAAVQPHRAKA